MSATRSRNKFCLSLDGLPSHTLSNTARPNRWSEVVPPKTALTFAALWDPEEGMVTFSGAALLESESVPRDDSQIFPLDCDSEGTTPGENTATLATFQDAFRAFLHRTPWNSREHLLMKTGQRTSWCLQTRASSTFDGLDVYSHDIELRPKRSFQLSSIDLLDIESSFRPPSAFGRLRLRSDLMLDSHRAESEESESSSRSRPLYLRSRFSTTTTSTSNYVDVTTSALHSTRTTSASETSPVPERRTNEYAASSWPSLPQRRRLLRKRRPAAGDASPGATSSIPSTPRKSNTKSSLSLFRPPPSTPTASSSRTSRIASSIRGRERRRSPTTPTPTHMSAPVPSMSPVPKSPRLKLRFALLSRRKPRAISPDADGWEFVKVSPVIRPRFMADPDDDD